MPFVLLHIPDEGMSDLKRLIWNTPGAGAIHSAGTVSAIFESDPVQFQMESEVVDECRKRHAAATSVTIRSDDDVPFDNDLGSSDNPYCVGTQ